MEIVIVCMFVFATTGAYLAGRFSARPREPVYMERIERLERRQLRDRND